MDCRKGFNRAQVRAYRARHGQTRRESLVAPDLQRSCEALEAQCQSAPREDWAGIIARFGWPRTPGYVDLARLTRECVAAKLHLPL